MTKRIVIDFNDVRGHDIDLISKIRNFGEDLMFELSRSGEGQLSIDEVDAAIDRISFKVALRKHYLDEIAK